MPTSSKNTEIRLKTKLETYLRRNGVTESVKRDWYPFRGQHAPFYTPITDIAVGPFAIEERLISRYNDLEAGVSELIRDLESFFRACFNRYSDRYPAILPYSTTNYAGNENARCFIAVEIESKNTSRKHKLGSILNAAALGRIGIVVGLDDNTVQALIRILGYLKFLASVEKPTFKADNTFIITIAQFLSILEGSNPASITYKARNLLYPAFKVPPQIRGRKSADGVGSDEVGHAKHARENSTDVSLGIGFNSKSESLNPQHTQRALL